MGGEIGAAASLVWVARLLPNLLKGIHFQRLGLLLTFIMIGMNDGLKGWRRGGGRPQDKPMKLNAIIVLVK